MGYPTSNGSRLAPHIAAQDEKLQALLGERGKEQRGLKALTRADVAVLGEIAIKATRVTAAPTAAEHNALLDDVKAIAALLNALGAKFTGL